MLALKLYQPGDNMASLRGRGRLVAILCTGMWLLNFADAHAQSPTIGKAALVRNDVRGTISARTAVINAGDAVLRDEGVRTGNDSEAKVVFVDSTNLVLSPNSSVTLDKFAYAGPGGAGQISMN